MFGNITLRTIFDSVPSPAVRAALAGLLPATILAATPLTPTLPGGWGIRWVGEPARQLATFEGVEEDRSNSHTGRRHIQVEGDAFRWDMHTVDRDGGDRQRHEVKGINVPGEGDIKILQGETWTFIYEMYLPASMTGGGRFNHIYQQKMVSNAGSSGGPVLTLSTSTDNTLLPRVVNGFKAIRLSDVWDKWVEVTLEQKFDFSGNGGYARWSVVDLATGTVLADQKVNGNVWANEGSRDRRVRVKWGIYRSLGSAGLKDTYMKTRNMRAYHLGAPDLGVGVAAAGASLPARDFSIRMEQGGDVVSQWNSWDSGSGSAPMI